MERPDPPDEKGRFSFVVYLAGDNNLSEEMVWSLQEMNAASREPSVRKRIDVAALFDPLGGEPRRYEFVRSAHPAGAAPDIRSQSVAEPARPRRESPVELLESLLAGMGRGRRILVLSGHGSGAVGDFLNDEDPASTLSIPRLGKILEGASIEILGLDSCQMSTVEVGFEVRGSVSRLIASEGPVLNTGWPYRQVLAAVAESEARSPDDIARAVAATYLRFYRDYEIAGVSTDIAVCDLAKIGLVAEAVEALGRAMTGPLSDLLADGLEEGLELGELETGASRSNGARTVRDSIVLAHWSAQSYKCDRYTDLYDFARQLLRFSAGRTGPGMDDLRKAGRGVLDAVEAAVVSSGMTGAELQHSHGLSIYFPWSFRDFFPEYRNLRFAGDTGWAKFLEIYLRATQRMRRFQSANLRTANVPAEPLRMPGAGLDPAATKDVEAGTRKDVEAGTRKGNAACRSTMKNPPDGYYPPSDRG
jgi:hypothetical protein